MFTVILPHKRNPGNDRALDICLSCLMANTVHDFRLLMDAAVDQPLYERVNRMVRQADTEVCVYLASDTFVAPGWDAPMVACYTSDTIVTNILVEPGAIAMHHLNIQRDFGRKPETFQRSEFEHWTQTEAQTLHVLGIGWPCPYLFNRLAWLDMGGLETDLSAPDGFTDADSRLWDRWLASGRQIVRAKSFSYHLQRYSDETEQTKVGR